MGRKYQVSWDARNRRWLKEYRGKKYAISCRQLSELMGLTVPETKDGSYQAANAWWEARKAEIDKVNQAKVRQLVPLEDLAAAVIGKQGPLVEQEAYTLLGIDSALRADAGEEVEVIIRIDKAGNATLWPASLGRQPPAEQVIAAAVDKIGGRVVTQLLKSPSLPEPMAACLPPARVQQVQDSAAGLRGETTAPAERTIAANCDRWLALQRAKVAAGKLAPDRADNLRVYLNHFRGFLGDTAAVESVDAQTIEAFFLWCGRKVEERQKDKDGKAGWSAIYAEKIFDTSRVFIRYLWESGLIELPKNIDSREFSFRVHAKKIETWTAEEFQAALAAATGQMRLHLLLMANCGFTQEDISDLLDTEVDWRAGRIIRKRSKTASCENVPTVDYKLWPRTFELLKEYRSEQERVLLTESGRPWKRKELIEGKLKKCDSIASCYVHLRKKLKGFNKPLKCLRKTGATLLDSHTDHSRFSLLFLGHSPRSVKDRYYSAPDQAGFDAAIAWLGQQLGQVPAENAKP